MFIDCAIGRYAVFFCGPFYKEFQEKYDGVLINCRNDEGFGHIAVRQPYYEKRFLRKPKRKYSVIWKRRCEKLFSICFDRKKQSVYFDFEKEEVNKSSKEIFFNDAEFKEILEYFPEHLKNCGFEFEMNDCCDSLTLKFNWTDGQAVIEQGDIVRP